MKKKSLSTLLASTAFAISTLVSLPANAIGSDVKKVKAPSVKSAAMQCYTLYSMMMDENPTDEFAHNVLGSQAMLMHTIYVIKATAPGGVMSDDEFRWANHIAGTSFIAAADSDSSVVVDKLIQCEGWREEVVQAMSNYSKLNKVETEMEIREMIQTLPSPKVSYELKGTSREQLTVAVDKAMAKYLKKAE